MMRRAWILIVIIAVGVAACRSADSPTGATQSTTSSGLSRVGGDSELATLGAVLMNPLVVRVADSHGSPTAGVTVTWQADSGAGTVSPASSTTDAQGHATTQWTIGSRFLASVVSASAAGSTVSFFALGNGSGDLQGRQVFPADNPWNADISAAPVDANSNTL